VTKKIAYLKGLFVKFFFGLDRNWANFWTPLFNLDDGQSPKKKNGGYVINNKQLS